MATSNPNKSKKLSPITKILIGLITVLVLLSVFVTAAVTSVSSRRARSDMQNVAGQRAKVIEDYAIWVEDTLDNFSYAGQIKEFLLDPENPEKFKAAQQLTVEFAEDVGSLEGLYIADWNAKTLTHSNPDTIGVVVREGERLEELHNALESCYDQVYNVGMVTSPNTGRQVIACYKAIRDDKGKAIGFVGVGVYTEDLLADLSSLQIGGLESAKYVLVDAKTNAYMYYDEDPSAVGKTCDIEDIVNINAQVESGAAEDSGIGTFKVDGVKSESAYYHIEQYHWTLFMNAPQSQVLRMTYQMQIFILIFGFLVILLVVVFGIINAHQESINRKLGNQIKRSEATQESLETAMFNDILTEVQNRTAFEMALEKENAHVSADHPCYFAMFDISELSVINSQFSNDAGDAVLCNTAEMLTKAFPDGTVYRTGDDEFVVAIPKEDNSTAAYNQVFREVTDAHADLLRPQETPDGTINVAYKIAMVRSSSDLSSTIVAVLKDMAKRGGRTNLGQVNFVDMDTL